MAMLVRTKQAWALPEAQATDEAVWLNRRQFAGLFAAGPLLAGPLLAGAGLAGPARAATGDLYPAPRNEAFASLDRPLSDEELVTTYNNFFEFGSSKKIWRAARDMKTDPWAIRIDGLVEQEREVDFEALLRAMPLEERLYRHRCVEAWSIAVPWTGFPLAALVAWARPLSGARYLQMETRMDRQVMPGLKQRWYPWPYTEGLTMEEATNELAFIATGAYGKIMPPQNGAPLRLAVPWKYGFKSIKSIVRFHFTDRQPETYWQSINSKEYGFWANVNPDVAHPRWSQASERFLIAKNREERRPTVIYNGYGDFVADLYAGLPGDTAFR